MWWATMQGLQGGRMTSGRGVVTEYHHRVVQSCILRQWLCLCVSFVVVFLRHLFDFWVRSVFCVLQKTRLTSSLHFFNWFLSTSTFTVAFFWGTFSDFSFSKISCCCKRHVLPLGCIFLDWFLRTILFAMVLSDQANLGFEWYKLWYGVQHLRGERVRTTSSPPTP